LFIVPDIRTEYANLFRTCERLLQHRLLDESSLIRFARERAIPATGVITGTPSTLMASGFLAADGVGYDDKPRFHPFRLYPIHLALAATEERAGRLWSTNSEEMAGDLMEIDRVVDFAVLLEPLLAEDCAPTAHACNR